MVIEVGRSCGCGNDLDQVLSLFQRATSIVMQHRMDLLMTQIPPEVEMLRLGLVCHPETPITDLTDSAMLIRLGYEEARQRIGDRVFH